ncbi:MAG: hypothetical protein HZB55_08520 [Deltaproteobacteria bacterium]|nr:hypothetical protein [Deltaproteobacteria bacterium]
MPVYLCRWPNGDVSLVEAGDTDEAAILLDEFGNADEAEFHHLVDLLVNFTLDDEGSLRVEQWGELTRREIYEVAYPRLEAALSKEFSKGWEPNVRPIPKRIRAAVDHERERGLEGFDEDETPQARTELGKDVQKSLGAPAALIDALTEHVGEQILKKAKRKGPKH